MTQEDVNKISLMNSRHSVLITSFNMASAAMREQEAIAREISSKGKGEDKHGAYSYTSIHAIAKGRPAGWRCRPR